MFKFYQVLNHHHAALRLMAVRHLTPSRLRLAPTFAVPELCQNPICLGCRELLFEREQLPQVVDNRHFRIELMECLEPEIILRNQQVGDVANPPAPKAGAMAVHEPRARPLCVVLYCAWNELWRAKWTAWEWRNPAILRLLCCLFCCPFWHPNG
jgi:hypothetical protein